MVDELGFAGVMVRVFKAPESTNFGDAVRRGLALNAEAQMRADRLHETRTGAVPVILPDTSAGWVWLLHDDSAPHPGALQELLRVGEFGRSIGIAGAKQLDWVRENHLLEVGIHATRTARRFNPIDEDEIDQGQHDAVDDVLAVGLAGAIIRRDVWAKLAGTDPALGPFGDGLELSRRARLAGFRVVVVPGAVVYHMRATYLGVRSGGPVAPDGSFGARRRAQLYNWILAAPTWQVPFVAVWLLLLTPARMLARFVSKDMALARAEASAGAAVLSRPDLWLAGRRRIRATQVLPAARLAELESSPREIRRKKREQRLAQTEARQALEAPSELEMAERDGLARRRRVALMVLVGLTTILTAFGVARLLGLGSLTGGGGLTGGGLLPSGARFSEVAMVATSGWIPVGQGSPGPVDPFMFTSLLALATGVSLGTAVYLLLLLATPVAAVGAWFAAGAFTRSIPARLWAAVLWAFAPSALFAIFQGRVGAVLTHVLLPFLLFALARAIGVARRDFIIPGVGEVPDDPVANSGPSLAAGASAALLLAAITTATPVLIVPGILLGLILLATPARRNTWFFTLPSLALFGPLAVEAAGSGDWEVFGAGPGVPFGYEPAGPVDTLLGLPAATTADGFPVWWAPVGLALAVAVAALFRGTFRRWTVRVGWLVAIAGLAIALAAPHVAIAVADGQVVRAWPGAGTSLALLGFIMAALAGADGIPRILARHPFGWQHLTAGALALGAGVGAVGGASLWVVAARSELPELQVLSAVPQDATPALSRELARGQERARTLALSADESGGVTAELWRSDGPALHLTASIMGARAIADPLGFIPAAGPDPASPDPANPDHANPDPASSELSGIVAELASGVIQDAGERLATHGVGAVLVPPAQDPGLELARADLISALDATPGLARVTENATGILWRVATDGREGAAQSIYRLTLRNTDDQLLSELPAGPIAASGSIPAGEPSRILVLTERADPRWELKVGSTGAAAVAHGWQQAFLVPAQATTFELDYSPPGRAWWLFVQALIVGLVALLALPVRWRSEVR